MEESIRSRRGEAPGFVAAIPRRPRGNAAGASPGRWGTPGIACAALLLGGCTLTAPLDPTADAPLPARDPEFVTIYVRNDTSREAVNVDFHASVAAIGPDVGTELFQNANRLAGLVGIAGSGLLQPGQADIVRWTCEDGVAVGTLGGTFLDANTGEVLGSGQRRWAQAGAQFTCGDLIVISFGATNDGYRTDMNIE